MRNVDPTGMYFNDKNSTKATNNYNKITKKLIQLEKKASALERKGKDASEIRERINELNLSKDDILNMWDNKTIEFRYSDVYSKEAKINNIIGPSTISTGKNALGDQVVTMFTENNIESQLHEGRHGGQISRNEYNFDSRNNPTSGYCIQSEVSAYRAQFAYAGYFNYYDATSELNQKSVAIGANPFTSTIKNINSITDEFVRTKIGEVRKFTSPSGKTFVGLIAIYLRVK